MPTRRALVGAALLGAFTIACNGFVGEWGFLDSFGKKFQEVQTGHSKAQVVGAVGPPARESTVFHLPQREGYEALFQQAGESHASSFLYWDTGVDEVAVVGLDESGRVVFKCRAGT
jgi:hypothetical protein